MIDGSKRSLVQVKYVRSFPDSVPDEDIHTKRIASLATATFGVMTGASRGVAVIGKSLAQARGLLPKHGVMRWTSPSSGAAAPFDVYSDEVGH
jgi:hypothetical protein